MACVPWRGIGRQEFKKIGLYSNIQGQISFKLGMMIGTLSSTFGYQLEWP